MGTDSNIFSKISEEETKELIVKLGKAILVPPEQETHKGTLYFLSNLDQNFPVIVRTFYCYEKCEGKSNETACRVIRDALSKRVPHPSVHGKLVYDFAGANDMLGTPPLMAQVSSNYVKWLK
ncbi:hypothetical protein LguiB_004188 [Lonicera macranthoides]